MRKYGLVLAAVVCGVSAVGVAAEAPTSSPGQSPTPVQMALDAFSSDDFSTRQKALQKLEETLAAEAIAMASTRDEESQAGVIAALEFDDGLIRWLNACLKQPAEERDRALSLASHTELFPTLSKVFSAKQVLRVEGVRELAKVDLPGIDEILAHLIGDDQRAVFVAAMDAAYGRKPTKPLVDALWFRAVDAAMNTGVIDPNTSKRAIVMFQGRAVPSGYDYWSGYASSSDGDLAVETLLHYDSPLVTEKVKTFFKNAGDVAANPNATEGQLTRLCATTSSIKNAYTLMQHYKPVESVPSLVSLATCRSVMKMTFGGNANVGREYVTNRLAPMAMVVLITHQNLDDYHLYELDQGEAGKQWVSRAEDTIAVRKLLDWWEKEGKKQYGASSSTADKTAMETP